MDKQNERIVAIMTGFDNQLKVLIDRRPGKWHTYTPTTSSRTRLDLWVYGKHNHIVLESVGPVVYIFA